LLDTHTLLWFALNDPQLSDTAMKLVMDPANEKLVSPAIKISIGKYTLSKPFDVFMQEAIDKNGFGYLHIEPKHTAPLTTLPFHHRDPFDRLLIVQAMVEEIPIVSGDRAFDDYPIKRLW
jgi:PIN domain nuclease of toxin-antitoxin system